LLLFVMDGGFCNRTVFRAPRKGARILVRCRKDAKLCLPANDPAQPRRIYAKEKFTPEDVRTNDSAWQKDHFFIGDKWRPVRFKQISSVLWQGGAGKLPLRLIVIAPIAYRLSTLATHCQYHPRGPRRSHWGLQGCETFRGQAGRCFMKRDSAVARYPHPGSS
jgi:hypothetical protein